MFEFDKIVPSCAGTPRTATVMTFLKYGHPPVVSTHECACRSSPFACSRNVIHYCIEILPLRTCTYVVNYYYWWYCPLRCESWATYVLSAFGLLVTSYVSVGPLPKRPCRAPSMNAASTRGIFVYAHTPSFQCNVCNTFSVMIPPWYHGYHP